MTDISIANWNKIEFQDNINAAMQQATSRLRAYIDWKPIKAKKEFVRWLGPTASQEKVGPAPESPNMAMNHVNRKITWNTKQWGTVLDRDQLKEIGSDPKNEYVQGAKKAFERDIDDMVISKMLATAYVGETGETTADLPGSALIQPANTANGLSVELLRTIVEYFELLDKDPDVPVNLMISPKGKSQLLKTTKYGSVDYNNVKALHDGKLNTFAGIHFVETNRLVLNGNGNRRLIAWVPGGFQGLIDESMTMARLTERADLSMAPYLYAEIRIGGARMQETMVAECPINEAA